MFQLGVLNYGMLQYTAGSVSDFAQIPGSDSGSASQIPESEPLCGLEKNRNVDVAIESRSMPAFRSRKPGSEYRKLKVFCFRSRS